MIAYNTQTLLNVKVLELCKQWYSQKLLTDKQFIEINNKHTYNFYSPNIFIRFGLFIFTCITCLASIGFISLIFSEVLFDYNLAISIISLLYGIIIIVILEHFIKSKKHYNSGIDNALLIIATASFSLSLFFIVTKYIYDSPILYIGLLVLLLLLCVMRYINSFLMITLLFSFYSFIVLIVMEFGTISKMIMPFVLMIISLLGYFILIKIQNKIFLFHYTKCIIVSKVFFLLAFYCSCNYFLVRESSQTFFNLELQNGDDIPLAFIFYLLTAITPLLYIYFGLKTKNKNLLWVGMFILATSAITFKYYFNYGHPEIALSLSGIILIAIAYFAIRYFNNPKFGITYVEDCNGSKVYKTNAEALLMAQTFGDNEFSEVNSDSNFGGGEFGGAGSGGNF